MTFTAMLRLVYPFHDVTVVVVLTLSSIESIIEVRTNYSHGSIQKAGRRSKWLGKIYHTWE